MTRGVAVKIDAGMRDTDWMYDQIRRSNSHVLKASRVWIAKRKSVTAQSRGNQYWKISPL